MIYAGHVMLARNGTMRGSIDDCFLRDRNVLHYVFLAGFVASCAMILPGVFFFAVETSNNEYSTVVRIPKATDLEWIFSLNEEENEIVRSEFYFEQVRSGESPVQTVYWRTTSRPIFVCLSSNCQAPSSSLCIAILSLHSDSIVCGHQLIEHCCKLSQGLTNPEVDAGLLMDIMKQLLFSAKMMFVKAGRSQDLALCDR